MGGTTPDGETALAPQWVTLLRATGLLAVVACSLGLAGWFLHFGRRLAAYVADNHTGSVDRDAVAIIGICSLLVAVAFALEARLRRRVTETRLHEMARRLSPLALAGPTVLLLDWRAWYDRPLVFLVLVALVALGLEAAIRVAAEQPPLFCPTRLGDRLRGFGASIGASAPRLVRGLPIIAVALAAILYSAYFGYFTVVNHLNGRSNAWDLGVFDNLVYNALHGAPLFKCSPIYGPEGGHFERHATFAVFVIAPIYAILQRAETLLVVQAVLVGAGALPLFAFARRRIGAWPACLVALAYLLYAPLHGSNLYDFHFLTLTPVFVFALLWAFESHRDWLAWILVLLTLSLREDVAVGLAVVGVYLVLSGARFRAGLAVVALGLGYFLVMKFAVMPEERGTPSFTHAYADLAPPDDPGLAGVAKTILGNPAYTLGTLLREDKLVYALQILVPVFLLPLRRWLAALLLLPGLLFALMASGLINHATLQLSFQYTAYWTPYVFIGTVLALQALRQPSYNGDPRGHTRLVAALAAMVISTVAASYTFGAVLQRHTARGGFAPYPFGTTQEDLEHRQIRSELIHMVPPKAQIAASERVLPHVSNRPDAYVIRYGVYDAEYILIRFNMPDCHPADRPAIVEALRQGDFGVVKIRKPFALLKRGHPTTRNRVLLRLMARRP